MKKENKNLQRIITFLILVIFALVCFIVFDKTKQNIKPTESVESIESKIEESVIDAESILKKDYTKEELVSLLKKKYTDNNMVKAENIDEWNIENVIYLGYLEIAPNIRYYAFEGYYSCKDNSASCINQEETSDDIEEGKNIFSTVLTVDEKENVELAGNYVPTADKSFIQVNQTIN